MRSLKIACAMLMLGGCGTYVPNLQVMPGTDESLFVQSIAQSIRCEISAAITQIINSDKAAAKINGIRTAAWLEEWGVQVGLTLDVNESTTVTPTGTWFPTDQFTLFGRASVSSKATRRSKLNYFYGVENLYDETAPLSINSRDQVRFCRQLNSPPGIITPPIVRSDLKIASALGSYILAAGTGTITDDAQRNVRTQQNGFTHTVRFELSAAGGVNPQWILNESTINRQSTLASASRNRTHELIVTFGPLDADSNLAQSAADSFLAAQINSSINLD